MTHSAAPIKAKFWTPGVVVLAVLMAAGAVAIAGPFYRRHRLCVQPVHGTALGAVDRG